jgi:hypothetical protein
MQTNYRRELLIELLADPSDPRSKTEKCLAAGYKSKREVFRLQRDPAFRQAVLAKMREHVGVNLPQVYSRLFKIAETGHDRDAIKACDALLRAAGEIASGNNQVVTVQQTNAEREPDDLDKRAQAILERRDREGGLAPRGLRGRSIDDTNTN